MSKDYYQVLGIGKNASAEEVRKAFHKLAHKYHPDKKGGDESKFKEINEAYQILSDQNKRQAYDTYGEAGSGNGPTQGGPNWGWDFGGFSDQAGGQSAQFDFSDLFSEFFGGGQGSRRRARRGRDISVDIQIPFAEGVFGNERNLLITKIGQCEQCNGTGAEIGSANKKCEPCNGRGQIRETRRSLLGSVSAVRACEVCNGTGEVPEKRCAICGGYGVLKKNEEIKVAIPAGINDGEMIRLTGRGEAAAHGTAGDLYVKVHVDKHSTFRREGEHLAMDLSVKLSDAILGAEHEIKTLDGQIKVRIPEGVSSGEILRVKGKGVPFSPSRRGDLYIHLKVKTPEKISKKARQLVEDLRGEGL